MKVMVPDTIIETAENFSASQMELGLNAPQITWENCLTLANDWEPLDPASGRLTMDALRDEIRDHVGAYGAWERSEIDGWTDPYLLAFLVQDMAAAVRELEANDIPWDDETDFFDVAAWEEMLKQGTLSGRLFPHGKTLIFQLEE